MTLPSKQNNTVMRKAKSHNEERYGLKVCLAFNSPMPERDELLRSSFSAC
jgi:hypothetical protein